MDLNDYAYSIYDDFVINHKVNITILQTEINESTIITSQLHHIDTNLDEDLCEVWFETALTQTEESELDNIIANHTAELPSGEVPGSDGGIGEGISDLSFTFNDKDVEYYFRFKNNKSYGAGLLFVFNGTKVMGVPKGIKAVLRGSGSLRLYNVTTSEVIFEWDSFDVIDEFAIFSQLISIWPEDECLLELQGMTDAEHLLISHFMICYTDLNMIDNFPTGV